MKHSRRYILQALLYVGAEPSRLRPEVRLFEKRHTAFGCTVGHISPVINPQSLCIPPASFLLILTDKGWQPLDGGSLRISEYPILYGTIKMLYTDSTVDTEFFTIPNLLHMNVPSRTPPYTFPPFEQSQSRIRRKGNHAPVLVNVVTP